jgi:hypothetical protein
VAGGSRDRGGGPLGSASSKPTIRRVHRPRVDQGPGFLGCGGAIAQFFRQAVIKAGIILGELKQGYEEIFCSELEAWCSAPMTLAGQRHWRGTEGSQGESNRHGLQIAFILCIPSGQNHTRDFRPPTWKRRSNLPDFSLPMACWCWYQGARRLD